MYLPTWVRDLGRDETSVSAAWNTAAALYGHMRLRVRYTSSMLSLIVRTLDRVYAPWDRMPFLPPPGALPLPRRDAEIQPPNVVQRPVVVPEQHLREGMSALWKFPDTRTVGREKRRAVRTPGFSREDHP